MPRDLVHAHDVARPEVVDLVVQQHVAERDVREVEVHRVDPDLVHAHEARDLLAVVDVAEVHVADHGEHAEAERVAVGADVG